MDRKKKNLHFIKFCPVNSWLSCTLCRIKKMFTGMHFPQNLEILPVYVKILSYIVYLHSWIFIVIFIFSTDLLLHAGLDRTNKSKPLCEKTSKLSSSCGSSMKDQAAKLHKDNLLKTPSPCTKLTSRVRGLAALWKTRQWQQKLHEGE